MFSNIFLLIINKNILLNISTLLFIIAIIVLYGEATLTLAKNTHKKNPRISRVFIISDLIVATNAYCLFSIFTSGISPPG